MPSQFMFLNFGPEPVILFRLLKNERQCSDKEQPTMRVMKAKEITGYCVVFQGRYRHIIM